ncbi:MAG: hypothetical protein AB7T49_02785 [Oligoflexales bacterium]
MSSYECTREHFDKLIKKYHAYLELYKQLNEGSVKGCTPFEVFYWRFTYLLKYEDTTKNPFGM